MFLNKKGDFLGRMLTIGIEGDDGIETAFDCDLESTAQGFSFALIGDLANYFSHVLRRNCCGSIVGPVIDDQHLQKYPGAGNDISDMNRLIKGRNKGKNLRIIQFTVPPG